MTAHFALDGTTVLCGCCGREKLAELTGSGLNLQDGRHGQKHRAAVPPRELMEIIAGTRGAEGMLGYVRRLYQREP